jgi:hypothetical protein
MMRAREAKQFGLWAEIARRFQAFLARHASGSDVQAAPRMTIPVRPHGLNAKNRGVGTRL